MIQGVITTKHLIIYAILIIQLFGVVVWLRGMKALIQHRRTTFLQIVMEG